MYMIKVFLVEDEVVIRDAIKNSIDNTSSLCGSKEVSTETNQSTGRNMELKTNGTVACSAHSLKLTLTLAEHLDNGTGKFLRNINVGNFHWL